MANVVDSTTPGATEERPRRRRATGVGACTNCGAELAPDARFCPRCAAPVPLAERVVAPRQRPRWKRAEPIAFAVLALLLVALITVLVLVFAFGVFVEAS